MKGELAAAFGFFGSLLEGISLAGRVVDVVVEVDEAELSRRARVEGGPPDRDLLRLMARLPYRQQLPLRSLDEFTRTLLLARGRGFVRLVGDSVERIWKPALEMRGFMVVSSDWRSALRRVSLFAADGPRAVGYKGSSKLTDACRHADELGVGLARINREIDVLVQPNRHLVVHDEIRWALAERLFETMRRHAARATA